MQGLAAASRAGSSGLMALTVDLNSDMGEGFGPWRMGDDAGLLQVVTSANVACGFHAGDADVMSATMRAAVERGVGIGAHPGFPDRQGFGRRRMQVPLATLANMIRYQVGAARAMARSVGGQVRHVKLHGALSNMASADLEMARACYGSALDVAPEIIVVGLAATRMEEACRELGCGWAGEIFADRAYSADGTLVDRRLPGATISDAGEAARRVAEMVREGAIITGDGRRLPARIDTVCVHGDGDGAVALATRVRDGLESAGIRLKPFAGTPLA